MTGFLRFIGVVNAAIWFGAAVFFTAVVGPSIFSTEMHKVFGEAAYPYYSGAVAMIVIKRYLVLQIICSAVALLHMFAEKVSLQRQITRFTTTLLLVLLSLNLIAWFWVFPKMQNLRQTVYFGQTQEQKAKAKSAFGALHGVSQVVNLVVIGGVLIYLVRLNRPVESVRYGGITKFRG